MSIHAKLTAIQSALKVPKSHTNAFAKYKYRNCEDILEALKPLLKEHGLVLTISDSIVLIGSRFYVKATAMLWDGTMDYGPNPSQALVSVEAFAREPDEKKGTDESQITGAASSYARKYALNGLFLIDDTADADSMDNSPKAKAAQARAPQPPAPKEPEKAKAAPAPVEARKHASADQMMEIANLIGETKSDKAKFHAWAAKELKVENALPTPEQATRMIAVLEGKLNKMIDAAAKNNS